MSDEQVGGKLSQSLAKVKAQPKATTRSTRTSRKAINPDDAPAPATKTTKPRTTRAKTTNSTKQSQKDTPQKKQPNSGMIGGLRVWPD
jgi:hypothetical protein